MFELRYEEYSNWHKSAEKGFLKPALATALRLVEELLDERIDSVDRGRFRISTSRVKSPQRSFAKLNREKYLTQIEALDDVPQVIDDLVGIRIICNNLSDINTFQEIIGELPIESGTAADSVTVEQNSHRDYFANPKPSGYRAYHVNLVVPVPHMTGYRRVRVELQTRTLLQDGWGELTHEDTYKPGSTVPQWIVGMSLRMAELLAAVDNIAQDLRIGLDVETQRSVREVDAQPDDAPIAFVASGPDTVVIPTPAEGGAGQQLDEEIPRIGRDSEITAALIEETLSAVHELNKPLPLAALSQQLTLVFGTEITSVWAELGGFKRFLESVVPNALLSGPSPGYIHPLNTPIPDGWTTEDTGTGVVPEITRELRTYDKALPLIGPERLDQVMVAVANVLGGLKTNYATGGNISAAEIDVLAREARVDAQNRGQLVVRPHATYVLQALNRAGGITPSTSVDDVRRVLLDRILEMGELNGLSTKAPKNQNEVREWLNITA
ncbi:MULTISPECIES: hypothetical protein [unclassified Arthrobacter]|uniref:GTP pyrophosphokinase n=1 Tax=unclassified Arthrobacter TaxID=235627 RepID=UPI002882DCBD|nr:MULTISPECIES: hypothetical protein [unclassified Arthrobacter]